MRVPAFAVLVLAAAPLRAQAADSVPACVPAPADSAGVVRWACAGTGYDAAVRFSVFLPADWTVTAPEDAGLVIRASQGGVQIAVAAEDQLHAPRTRADTAGFWMRATRLVLARDPTLEDLQAFRRRAANPDKARRAVTAAQLRDSVLLAMAGGLSAAHEDRKVVARAAEVRRLAGRPAGYLAETFEADGIPRRAESYVTVRDAVMFIATLECPDSGCGDALPVWERALASLRTWTERSAAGRERMSSIDPDPNL
ncbi:MAG TPA: hypothetical protein VGC13_06525 [Longimicrobium sp.]|jgi:hypothetical protein|uniref:hypothetical protein n=1 Tax=Longimicrobium sp. TaxID=2029185 RepID=UPI002ED8BAEE